VLQAPRMRHAANIIFILESSPLVFGRGRWLTHYGGKS
jgi:hypothetical protein